MVFAYLITEKISQVYEVQRLGYISTMNLPRKTKYRDLYRAIGCRIVNVIYSYDKIRCQAGLYCLTCITTYSALESVSHPWSTFRLPFEQL